jgi:NIMA (never in mitosis gene a)-related kinase 2
VWREEQYSFKSDIWSLGCVIYEMLALKPPFVAADMGQLFHVVQKGEVKRIPKQFSDDMWSVIQALL